MTYRLVIVPAAERGLARLDPPAARRIRDQQSFRTMPDEHPAYCPSPANAAPYWT